MPTYTFTRTREQLRNAILRKLGRLATGQTPSAEDANIVYEAMDMRLKEMHAKGTLWFNVAGAATDVAVASGTATAAVTADVLFPLSVNVVVNAEEQPLRIIGHREYQEIPDKATQGEPDKVFFAAGVLYFHPVPNRDYTAKMTYQQVAADTTANTPPDVEVSMLRSFKNVVAYDLVDDFMLQDENKIMRFKLEADDGLKTIFALNQERVDNGTVAPEYF